MRVYIFVCLCVDLRGYLWDLDKDSQRQSKLISRDEIRWWWFQTKRGQASPMSTHLLWNMRNTRSDNKQRWRLRASVSVTTVLWIINTKLWLVRFEQTDFPFAIKPSHFLLRSAATRFPLRFETAARFPRENKLPRCPGPCKAAAGMPSRFNHHCKRGSYERLRFGLANPSPWSKPLLITALCVNRECTFDSSVDWNCIC